MKNGLIDRRFLFASVGLVPMANQVSDDRGTRQRQARAVGSIAVLGGASEATSDIPKGRFADFHGPHFGFSDLLVLLHQSVGSPVLADGTEREAVRFGVDRDTREKIA